jgi:hypothetical protein
MLQTFVQQPPSRQALFAARETFRFRPADCVLASPDSLLLQRLIGVLKSLTDFRLFDRLEEGIGSALMAIALHKSAAHQSDSLMKRRGRWTDDSVARTPPVDGRVNRMTTLAANFDGALSTLRTTVPVESVPESCSCAFALTGHGEAYNEHAFHHFLSIERKRSEASRRPFLLLLVEFDKHLGEPVPIGHDVASRLFAAVAASLRDTDVIGWYREQRIAGAVLTDLGEAPQTIMPAITQRVRAFLQNDLPGGLASLVQVRLYQLPARIEAAAETFERTLEFA